MNFNQLPEALQSITQGGLTLIAVALGSGILGVIYHGLDTVRIKTRNWFLRICSLLISIPLGWVGIAVITATINLNGYEAISLIAKHIGESVWVPVPCYVAFPKQGTSIAVFLGVLYGSWQLYAASNETIFSDFEQTLFIAAAHTTFIAIYICSKSMPRTDPYTRFHND